jgi:SH3-like domain-containing protein
MPDRTEPSRALEGAPPEGRMPWTEAARRAAAALGLSLAVTALGLLILIAGARGAGAAEAAAAKPNALPLPRFVSLKSDRVNVRRGPSRDHAVTWTYTRGGTPVEVVAEFDNWRRVRDSEGDEGWVFHSMLSGKRTALVAPWSKQPELRLHAKPDPASRVVARLEPKVLARVDECDKRWCRISGPGFSGWMAQENLWGVYPDEIID